MATSHVDPLLARRIVGESIRGVQSEHVVSTMKHYAMNDLETARNFHSAKIGEQAMREVTALLKQSIQYALDHRQEALNHALQYGRDLDRSQADKFVGMYVNDWTLDFGPRGREAVTTLLRRAYDAQIVPHPVRLEFIG